ncbi:putative baseplate assembly protein [Massilia aurea]|uniref:putative baseplate assembly protein n=1 Tax=Massilia aurea TaxID=373040 RepID=UPI003461966E
MNGAPSLGCASDDRRRALVRRSGLNGFDHVEVDCEQTTLAVTFLDHAPEWISAAHLRIDGGRGVRITDLRVVRSDDADLDDIMLVTVDRPGDFSSYRLCAFALDAAGRPTAEPPAGFDPRYACVCFSFKGDCPSDLDCGADETCAPETLDEPALDYLAKDYASLRRLLLDRLALLLPDWTERHVPDLGITLVELLAYVGDNLSYHQDAVATEAYLDTARLRVSVRRHARLVDYLLHEGCNARAWLAFEVDDEELVLQAADFYAITRHPRREDPVLAQADLTASTAAPWLAFEPRLAAGQAALTLRQARNRIAVYRWGEDDCCLAAGATSATLLDPGHLPAPGRPEQQGTAIAAVVPDGRWHRLKLKPGEVLLFEELVGPHTGDPADADPARRHAVRLTRAAPSWDPLTRRLLWEVEWCIEDALPFALCLSTVGDAPGCKPLSDLTIAWGNVALFDHGLGRDDDLGRVPVRRSAAHCEEPCEGAEVVHQPGRFRPALPRADPTFATPAPACVPGVAPGCCTGCGDGGAVRALRQDAGAALPEVWLSSILPGETPDRWTARHDLLGSGPDDRHFVVEIDDRRLASLRFGDGQCGRAPVAGEAFHAHYRTGNGVAGNVGADALTQLVFIRNFPNGSGLRVRNPLPATGGAAPEDVAEARLRAPQAFRRRLERAVTAADYAAIVMRDFAAQVQRAAAVMRASGAGTVVQVAIDARGRADPPADLLCCIAAHLECYRRIGHEVRVVPVRQVPLAIGLHICVKPGYLRGHVKAALLGVLGAARPTGFFHPDALEPGKSISASRIVAAAQAVAGVSGVLLERFERQSEGPDGELESGILPIGPLEVARLDNDPVFPGNGQLDLDLEGGR